MRGPVTLANLAVSAKQNVTVNVLHAAVVLIQAPRAIMVMVKVGENASKSAFCFLAGEALYTSSWNYIPKKIVAILINSFYRTAEDLTATSRRLARYENLLAEILPMVSSEVRELIEDARDQVRHDVHNAVIIASLYSPTT